MDCPRNHEPLKEIEFEGVLVDICPSCGGVWFDPKELEKFDEAHEEAGQKLLELMESYQKVPIDHDHRLSNPRSPEIDLVRRYYSPKEQIEIDECPITGGIWLNGGDLHQIRELFPSQEDRRLAYRDFAVRWKNSNDIEKMKRESTLRARKADQVSNLLDWLFR
jgi:uncharacterized protein